MIQRIFSRLLALILLLGCTGYGAAAKGEEFPPVEFGGVLYPADSERISIGSAVTDFDAFESFLARFTNLQQVDMWDTLMPAEECHRLAEKFPGIRWGWTMV